MGRAGLEDCEERGENEGPTASGWGGQGLQKVPGEPEGCGEGAGGRGAWGTGCGLVQRFRDKTLCPRKGKAERGRAPCLGFLIGRGEECGMAASPGARWDAPAPSSEGGLADSGRWTRACCQRPGHRGRAAGARAAGPGSAVGPSSGASQRRLRACGPWGGRKEDGGPGCPGRAGLSCRAIPQRAVQDHLSATRSLPRRGRTLCGRPPCLHPILL